MKGIRRTHSYEYKQRVVQAIESGVCSQAALCRKERIASSLVDRWRKQVREGIMHGKPTTRERQLEQELSRCQKKIGELTMENEALKKIDEYLLRTRRSSGSIVTAANTGSREDVQS